MVEKNGIRIITLDRKNITEYPPTCFLSPQNEGYLKKLTWIKSQFSKGLTIKVLYPEVGSKCIAFIEYIPGENAWRSVDAKGYLFIHCIWVYSSKNKEHGYGSLLIKECFEDAKKQNKYGVAVVASEDAFMVNKELFLKNGFKSVAQAKPSFDLMVKVLRKSETPKFNNWQEQLDKYRGLNIIYSKQCPWVVRGIQGMVKIAKEKGLKLNLIELTTARQAQDAPSIYASFSLIHNQKLLANHYISNHRFRNIINKELI